MRMAERNMEDNGDGMVCFFCLCVCVLLLEDERYLIGSA